METKKINFSGLKKVLSVKEMKNVTGGSDSVCPSDTPWPIRCANGDLQCMPNEKDTC